MNVQWIAECRERYYESWTHNCLEWLKGLSMRANNVSKKDITAEEDALLTAHYTNTTHIWKYNPVMFSCLSSWGTPKLWACCGGSSPSATPSSSSWSSSRSASVRNNICWIPEIQEYVCHHLAIKSWHKFQDNLLFSYDFIYSTATSAQSYCLIAFVPYLPHSTVSQQRCRV